MAATSTPTVMEPRSSVSRPELKAELSPIPVVLPESSHHSQGIVQSGTSLCESVLTPAQSKVVANLKRQFGTGVDPQFSPLLEIGGSDIFAETDNAVVPISINNDLALKALRRLSSVWMCRSSQNWSRQSLLASQRETKKPPCPPLFDRSPLQEEEERTDYLKNPVVTDISLSRSFEDGKENPQQSQREEFFARQTRRQTVLRQIQSKDLDSSESKKDVSLNSQEDMFDVPRPAEQEDQRDEKVAQEDEIVEALSHVSFTTRRRRGPTDPPPPHAAMPGFSDDEQCDRVDEPGRDTSVWVAVDSDLENISSQGSVCPRNDASSSASGDEEASGSVCYEVGDATASSTSEGESGDEEAQGDGDANVEAYLSVVGGTESPSGDEGNTGLETPATEQKRNFSRLSVGEHSGSPFYLRGMAAEKTPMEECLFVCQQDLLLTWTRAFHKKMISGCKKIGEGVYGEVFRTVNPIHGDAVALKVIPVCGVSEVNGERQKSLEEILPEILIAKEMSALAHTFRNMTPNFVEVKSVRLIQGRYPKKLLDAWDEYDREKVSENERPGSDIFPADQLFVVFEFGDGGCDLESFKLCSVREAYSILGQVILALAVAEEELEFEHRDLHIGNILVKRTDRPTVGYRFREMDIELNTFGLIIYIIDFTNSRLRKDGCTIFTDLSSDETLFQGPEDEYQFEVYRMMRRHNRNEWKHYEPQSNLFWIHYLVDKFRRVFRFGGRTLDEMGEEGEARKAREVLGGMKGELLSFRTSIDVFGTDAEASGQLINFLLSDE